jgi:hypothetical protein
MSEHLETYRSLLCDMYAARDSGDTYLHGLIDDKLDEAWSELLPADLAEINAVVPRDVKQRAKTEEAARLEARHMWRAWCGASPPQKETP